jgi:hypothetical protein
MCFYFIHIQNLFNILDTEETYTHTHTHTHTHTNTNILMSAIAGHIQ